MGEYMPVMAQLMCPGCVHVNVCVLGVGCPCTPMHIPWDCVIRWGHICTVLYCTVPPGLKDSYGRMILKGDNHCRSTAQDTWMETG